jgi:hypothetical protein
MIFSAKICGNLSDPGRVIPLPGYPAVIFLLGTDTEKRKNKEERP